MSKEQLNPHRVRKELIKDELAYVQSLGKHDIDSLGEAINKDKGKGTVLRCFLGATTLMPLRALSYVGATARVAEIVPCEQIQFVNVLHVNKSVNHTDIEVSRKQAELLAGAGGLLLRLFSNEVADKAVFVEDSPRDMVATNRLRPIVEIVAKADRKLGEDLGVMGERHGGDPLTYGAAHVVYQDTNDFDPVPLNSGSPPVVHADRVIAVGGLKERTFYGLRIAARSKLDPTTLLPSVQIFTNHAVPPYYEARGGEQSLAHALEFGVDMSLATDTAAARDMQYLINTIETLGERK